MRCQRHVQLTLAIILAGIDIVPNGNKSAETDPDFRLFTEGVEVGRLHPW